MGNHIVLNRDAVHAALARIAALAGKPGSTAPIVGHALIEHDATGIRVTATDMDAWLTATIPAEGKRFKPLALPARDLHDVIAALPAGAHADLSWDSEDATVVTLKSGRARFQIPIMAASDFPEPPRSEAVGAQFTASAASLNMLLKRSKWAVNKEETRYYLNGVFLHVKDDRLLCAATNGNFLAKVDAALPDGAAHIAEIANGGVIVPSQAVKVISGLVGADDADIDLTVTSAHVTLEREDNGVSWTYTSRLIDGTFPDYDRVIPNLEGLTEVDVQTTTLTTALARVALLAEEGTNTVRLDGEKGMIRISATGPGGRAAQDEIDAAWAAKPIGYTIGVNAAYLTAALEGISADVAVLAFGADSASPIVLRPRGRDDTLAVLMPVKV